jgi:hypothetical protein
MPMTKLIASAAAAVLCMSASSAAAATCESLTSLASATTTVTMAETVAAGAFAQPGRGGGGAPAFS